MVLAVPLEDNIGTRRICKFDGCCAKINNRLVTARHFEVPLYMKKLYLHTVKTPCYVKIFFNHGKISSSNTITSANAWKNKISYNNNYISLIKK